MKHKFEIFYVIIGFNRHQKDNPVHLEDYIEQ